MKRILFFGDSVTDCGRAHNSLVDAGKGYAAFVKSELTYKYPTKYEFINKGISGNRIVDLYARKKVDLINLSPDYISILIGVNDVAHELYHKNGVNAKRYEDVYSMLVS